MGFFGGILDIATGLIPGTLDDRLVAAGRRAFSPDPRSQGIHTPSMSGFTAPRSFTGGAGGAPCPTGYSRNARGQCERSGVAGAFERVLPGDLGNDQFAFEAAVGRYGYGAVPHEELRPHLVCPRGMVLGKDGLCYDGLSNTERKWKKGPKPFLTGGEKKALRTANRLRAGKGNKEVMALMGYSRKKK